ncbi:MAG: lamin tail domain-containing protein, partial [Deltaproteobacteria bacterium]|nr:lamin tail domain-containing protein [Deltaproteobacteria bacterium]
MLISRMLISRLMVRSLAAVALTTVVGLACSTGDPATPFDSGVDRGHPDLRVDTVTPDTLAPDTVTPDGPVPDTLAPDLLALDLGPCGNGIVDPGEDCDPAILVGEAGACPTDCNDDNTCTNDTFKGNANDCSARCEHAPISPCCGNGITETGEVCDDGNQNDKDGCNNLCKLPGGHLLITEIATSPSEAEFIEIYNPSTNAVPLKDVYLSDRIDYFQVVDPAQLKSGSTDFVVRFPDGAILNPGAYAIIATNGFAFKVAYSKAPDYEIKPMDSGVPDMIAPTPKALGSQTGLTDTGEFVVMFQWNGESDLVSDLDYVVWKGSSATAFAKSPLICMDGPDTDTGLCSDTPSPCTCYKEDTPVIFQSSLHVPQQGGSLHRCDYHETGERKTGGNGVTGHDETSEPFAGSAGVAATWKRNPKTLSWRTP